MIIRNFVLILSIITSITLVFAVSKGLKDGKQAFTQPVEELPSYPIVLKPYKWIILFYCLTAAVLLAIVALLAAYSYIQGRWAFFVVGGIPVTVIGLIIAAAAFEYSTRTIVLEESRLIYRRHGRDSIVNLFDIHSFKGTPGYFTLIRSDGSEVKISLYFENIRYLNAVLKQWFAGKTRRIVGSA